MKVYVDELPKSCLECKFAYKTKRQQTNKNGSYMEDCMMCVPLGEAVIERHNICPLQTFAEHDKQVRKAVLDIIDEKFNCCGYVEEKFDDIKKYVLDQIQGEKNE